MIYNKVALVTSKGSDQTAHKCSLIRVFVCHISHLWKRLKPKSEQLGLWICCLNGTDDLTSHDKVAIWLENT